MVQSSFTVDYGTSISTSSNTVTVGTGNTSTATPKSQTGYSNVFSSWTTSDCGSTVTKACTITANFSHTANIYTITLNNQSATTAGTASIYEKYNNEGIQKIQNNPHQIFPHFIPPPIKDMRQFSLNPIFSNYPPMQKLVVKDGGINPNEGPLVARGMINQEDNKPEQVRNQMNPKSNIPIKNEPERESKKEIKAEPLIVKEEPSNKNISSSFK